MTKARPVECRRQEKEGEHMPERSPITAVGKDYLRTHINPIAGINLSVSLGKGKVRRIRIFSEDCGAELTYNTSVVAGGHLNDRHELELSEGGDDIAFQLTYMLTLMLYSHAERLSLFSASNGMLPFKTI